MSRQDDSRFLAAALSLGAFTVPELAGAARVPVETAKTWFRRERKRALTEGHRSRFEPVGPGQHSRAMRWQLTSAAAAEVQVALRRVYAEALEARGILGPNGGSGVRLRDLDAAEQLLAERNASERSAAEDFFLPRIAARVRLALDEACDLADAGVSPPSALLRRLGELLVLCRQFEAPFRPQSLGECRRWLLLGLARLSSAEIPPMLAAPLLHGIMGASEAASSPEPQSERQRRFRLAGIGVFGTVILSPPTVPDLRPHAEAVATYACAEWPLTDLLHNLLSRTPPLEDIKYIVASLGRHPVLRKEPATAQWLALLMMTNHFDRSLRDVIKAVLLGVPGVNMKFVIQAFDFATHREREGGEPQRRPDGSPGGMTEWQEPVDDPFAKTFSRRSRRIEELV